MMENISVKDKIKVFEEKIKAKKEELAYLKKNVHIDPLYLEDRIVCNVLPKMVEGSFLFFLVQDNPTFLQIIEVV